MSRRVFVCVSGGVVDEVIVPPQADGTWTVIDWDNIESDPTREWGRFDEEDKLMISTVISSLRLLKGVYDLAFSEDPFYGEQRSEFLGGIQHCVEQAKEGYHNPPLPAVYVRKPFKILLGIVMFVLFLAVLIGGR